MSELRQITYTFARLFLFLIAVTLAATASHAFSSGKRPWTDPRIDRYPAHGRVLPFRQRLLGYSTSELHHSPTTNSAAVAPAGSPRRFPFAAFRGARSRADGNELQLAWERNYAENTIQSRDNANAAAIGPSGEVCVTGYSEATYSSGDYVTVKYDAAGDSLWSRRYNGSGNNVDEATSIGVDMSGNVLVTGYSYNEGGNTDIVTLKYDPYGSLVWERRYGGEAESTDVATALATDTAGNVFVTGYSYGANQFDYLTISYAPDGTLRWVARLDGEGHGTDVPTSLAVAPDGGVFVTGFSEGSASGLDILTVRYLAGGGELWHVRTNGSANGDDRGSAIAAGADGSCYVTGSAFTSADNNFLTMKYDPSGAVLWMAEFDGTGGNDDRATAIALEEAGDILVTGFSLGVSGRYGFATVKYDNEGTQMWSRFYTTPPNTDGFPTALVSHPLSGITLTGYVNDALTGYSTILTLRYDQAGTRLWANTYDGQPNSYDIGVAIVADTSGNTLVAGTAIGPQGSPDYVVIRYDAPRFPYWPVRFDATGNVSEKFTAMAVDGEGNVYVTGFGFLQSAAAYGVITAKFDANGALVWKSVLDSSGEDLNTPVLFVDENKTVYVGALSYYGGSSHSAFVAAKFAPDGTRQWASRYEMIRQSEIKGIVVDRGGNVYIAGSNFYQRQMITIKYGPDGAYQWGNFQNGSAGAIGIDSADNVIVTGTADGLGSGSNIVTVKFDPSGLIRWSNTFSAIDGSIEGSSAMSIDRSGNAVVAGSVYTSEAGYQFVVVKYDSTGAGRWFVLDSDTGRSYSSPVSVVATDPDRVFVTGRSPSTNNFSTVAYDAAGTMLWRREYNGDGPGNDDPRSLALAANGDVVVAGSSPGEGGSLDFVAVRYSKDGNQKWVARYDSPANGADDASQVVIDRNGFAFVGGTSKGDYLIIRIDDQGAFAREPEYKWPAHFNGAGLSDVVPAAIAADSSGTFAVAGSLTGENLQTEMFLANYSADGTPSPPASYTGNGVGAQARSIAIDRHGNRYVTGDILRLVGTTDIATLKYAPDGTRLWVAKYNGLADSYDFARAVTVDDSGNVYTGGFGIGRNSGYDFIVIKYGQNGIQQWEARYNGPANGDDILSAMKVDAAGNVYVTGLSIGAGGKGDFATVKYDRTGNQLWVAIYDGPAHDDDRPSSLSLDNTGNVYVAGSTRAGSGYYDFAVVKYDTGGGEQWAMTYDGPGGKDDFARSVVVDDEYHVTVTGESDGGATLSDFATLQYDIGGQMLWLRRFDGGVFGDDRPRAMTMDGEGSVYITGKSRSGDGTNDFVTIKYLKDGSAAWTATYALGPNVEDEPSGIVLDNARNVVVTGSSFGANWSVATTVKYSQTLAGVIKERDEISSGFRLYGNYPNPFNPSTTIRYSVPRVGPTLDPPILMAGLSVYPVSLRVYDLLGQLVATLVDERKAPGEYRALWNAEGRPSGVYYVRMTAGAFSATQKMLLVR